MILLTEPRAALRLRVQVATLRRLHKDHGLPGGVVAGEWRISASELDRWARDRNWHHPTPPIRRAISWPIVGKRPRWLRMPLRSTTRCVAGAAGHRGGPRADRRGRPPSRPQPADVTSLASGGWLPSLRCPRRCRSDRRRRAFSVARRDATRPQCAQVSPRTLRAISADRSRVPALVWWAVKTCQARPYGHGFPVTFAGTRRPPNFPSILGAASAPGTAAAYPSDRNPMLRRASRLGCRFASDGAARRARPRSSPPAGERSRDGHAAPDVRDRLQFALELDRRVTCDAQRRG
jgi:hypothetical protein